MNFKKIIDRINPIEQCKQYNIELWQCPSFLFPIIGTIIITTMVATFFIANEFISSPEVVALIITIVTSVLMVIGYLIVGSFEHLVQANEMKSEFVSIVSHQLRTPLTSIRWMVDLMSRHKDKFVDQETPSELTDIKESTARMIRLVNDLLNVSRIEQGRISFSFENVDIKELADEIVHEFEAVSKARNIKITLEAEDIPQIVADRNGLELIIKNLIDNAIKYSKREKEGRIVVKISKRGGNIHCEVEDNGMGISEKDKRRIFQKFFRGEHTLRYQTTGTGLGLYIAKEFIREFKGKMGFKSQEGKGSTFWFEIPIKNKKKITCQNKTS